MKYTYMLDNMSVRSTSTVQYMLDNIGTFPISNTFMLPLSYNRLLVIGTDSWRSVSTNNYLFSPTKRLIVCPRVQYQILYHEYQAYK